MVETPVSLSPLKIIQAQGGRQQHPMNLALCMTPHISGTGRPEAMLSMLPLRLSSPGVGLGKVAIGMMQGDSSPPLEAYNVCTRVQREVVVKVEERGMGGRCGNRDRR